MAKRAPASDQLPPNASAPEPAPRLSWWRRLWPELPGLLTIAATVALIFRPLLGMDTLMVTPEGDINLSDMMHSSYPFRVLLGQALAKGHLPVWTDKFLCGFPLVANPAMGTFYPLNWLFAILPGPAAMSLGILVTGTLAGWFAYYYARTIGLDRLPATLAGLSFAGCGFLVSHSKQVALFTSATWLPLHFALVERAVREPGPAGRRAALWLAPAVAASAVAGGIQFLYISLLGAGLYGVMRSAGRLSTEFRWRAVRLGLLVLTVVWGVALAAPQVLPSWELTTLSERAVGLTPAQADPIPMPARDLVTLFSDRAVGRPSDGSYPRGNGPSGLFWEDYIYAGWPIVLLAVIGLPWTLRQWPHARWLLALGVVGVALALGERGLLFPLAFRLVPGLAMFRFPERFLLWTEFAVALLGAMGAHVLFTWLRGRTRIPVALAVVVVAAADLVTAQAPQNVYYPAAKWLAPPETATTIRASGARGVPLQAIFIQDRYAALFSQGGWAAHTDALWAARAMLDSAGNAVWGVPMVDGYMDLIPEWDARLWVSKHATALLGEWIGQMIAPVADRAGAPATPPRGFTKLLGAANVQYVTCQWPLRDARLQAVPTREALYFYRNLDAMGRAYLVPEAVDMSTDENFISLVRAGEADFRGHVYLVGTAFPAKADFTARPVSVHDSADLTGAVLEPDAPAPCWLVLSDAYYPGWRATVDGRPVMIERGNGTMRAVAIPAGKHRVEFRYESRPLKVGMVAAAVGLLLWVGAMVGQRRGEAAKRRGGGPGRTAQQRGDARGRREDG